MSVFVMFVEFRLPRIYNPFPVEPGNSKKHHSMKKIFLSAFLLCAGISLAQSWQDLGTTQTMASVPNVNIAGRSNFLHLVYTDYVTERLSAKVYNGSTWTNYGSPNFAEGELFNNEILTVLNDIPYVLTRDSLLRTTVMMHNGTDWVVCGEPLSTGEGGASSITNDNVGIYVAYYESLENGVTVKRYDGVSWITVGNSGFSNGFTSSVSISVSLGLPSVACQENTHLSVLHFDGTSWDYVGSPEMTSMYASSLHLRGLGPYHYLSYEDEALGCRLRVIANFGNGWIPISESTLPLATGLHSSLEMLYGVPLLSFIGLDGYPHVMYEAGEGWLPIGYDEPEYGIVTHTDLNVFDGEVMVGYRSVNENDLLKVKYLASALGIPSISRGEVTLSPNPSSDVIVIQSSAPILAIRIRDSKGSLVSTTTMPTADIRALSSGVYIVEIETQEGMVTKRFIRE